ncbi:hypothetical protein OAH18_01895, partial [bacterium]|nr:hypothetical protein [bacterium]
PFPSTMTAAINLSGQDVRILISDEEAKANVNFLHYEKPNSLERFVKKATPSRSVAAIQLRPFAVKTKQPPRENDDGDDEDGPQDDDLPQAFGAWSQVFRLSAINGGVDAVPMLTTKLTCWGPGRLNIARADRETAIQFCGEFGSRTGARNILEAWWEDPRLSLPNLIKSRGNLADDEVAVLQQVLVKKSSTYSVTVGCQSQYSTSRRFAVLFTDEDGALSTVEFVY